VVAVSLALLGKDLRYGLANDGIVVYDKDFGHVSLFFLLAHGCL
jgi:hypothetical protein